MGRSPLKRGHVFSRGSTWYVAWPGGSANGGRDRYAVGTKVEAERELAKLRAAAADLHDSTVNRTRTLQHAVDAFFIARRHKKSLDADRQRLGRILRFFGSDALLRNVRSRPQIEAFGAWLEQQVTEGNGTPKPISAATYNRTLALLKSILLLAFDYEWMERPPPKKWPFRVEVKSSERALYPHEIQALRDADPSPDLRVCIELGYLQLMRRGEAFDLRWRDIDFALNRITIRETKNGSPRVIPLATRTREVLQAHAPASLAKLHATNAKVLTTSIHSFGHRWERLAARAGIAGKANFHWLRHTGATELRRAGVSLVDLMQIGGWKSWKAMLVYQHVDDVDIQTAMLAREGGTGQLELIRRLAKRGRIRGTDLVQVAVEMDEGGGKMPG